MKICVYCSSREDLHPDYYKVGEAFGRLLAKRGHALVYGGYNKGIMAAVARGVLAEGGAVTAVVPELFKRPGFTLEGCTRVIYTPTMHTRKASMEEESDAFAILPGGIGTFDEFFEVYVLKSLKQTTKPIALLNVRGCYDLLEAFLNQNTEGRFLTPENRSLITFYSNGEALLTALECEANAQ